MDTKTTICLKVWNSETGLNEETGETLNTYQIAKSLSLENFAALLDDFLNLGGKGFREGKEAGLQLTAREARKVGLRLGVHNFPPEKI